MRTGILLKEVPSLLLRLSEAEALLKGMEVDALEGLHLLGDVPHPLHALLTTTTTASASALVPLHPLHPLQPLQALHALEDLHALDVLQTLHLELLRVEPHGGEIELSGVAAHGASGIINPDTGAGTGSGGVRNVADSACGDLLQLGKVERLARLALLTHHAAAAAASCLLLLAASAKPHLLLLLLLLPLLHTAHLSHKLLLLLRIHSARELAQASHRPLAWTGTIAHALLMFELGALLRLQALKRLVMLPEIAVLCAGLLPRLLLLLLLLKQLWRDVHQVWVLVEVRHRAV